MKRPYYHEVADVMGSMYDHLVQKNGGRGGPDLVQQAYDSACLAVPEVRAKIEAGKAWVAEQEQQAQRAKQASVGVSGNSDGSTAYPVRTIDQTLSDMIDETGFSDWG